MIIKMVNEFKFTVAHFARPNLQSVHAHGFITGQKTVENQDWAIVPLGHQASGLSGRPVLYATGPLGHWATGLLWAAGLPVCL